MDTQKDQPGLDAERPEGARDAVGVPDTLAALALLVADQSKAIEALLDEGFRTRTKLGMLAERVGELAAALESRR